MKPNTLAIILSLSMGLRLIQSPYAAYPEKSIIYLDNVMDQYHNTIDVYTDADVAGNHFAARGKMSRSGDADAVPIMNEACMTNPHSGINCIQCTFIAKTTLTWGGWYFMNGVLQGTATTPSENWGDYPNAGVNLQDATKLTFWARGSTGSERVEFFCCGIGYVEGTGNPNAPYPDSSKKNSTGYVTLSNQWTKYTINLQGKDISYVLGGFGWVSDAQYNNNHNITFYIDDIQYDKTRLNEPRFLVSYQTISSNNDFDIVMRNVAYSYDNAVALLSFLVSGKNDRAQLIADAFVYAQQHDRYYSDGRLRNAYQAGDLILPPGWTPNGQDSTVRMAGWYDSTTHQWFEDKVQASTYTGNVAWVMLGLLAYYESTRGSKYLSAVEEMGEWIEQNCLDTTGIGGYTGGFEGWEPNPTKLTYKSTEHNIDLYAVFERLYLITGEDKWQQRAQNAKRFVHSMWDNTEKKFWTGTLSDGISINTTVVPLDVQSWSILAMKAEGKSYWKALDYAELHHKVGNGFDFNQDCDGIWYEGTGQMATAYYHINELAKWDSLITLLLAARDTSGGLPAANKDRLTTGFSLPNGQPWLYFKRLHIGATGWLVFAEKGINPFWLGSKLDLTDIPDVKLLKGNTQSTEHILKLNDYLVNTTSASWIWSSQTTYANIAIDENSWVDYNIPISSNAGQDTVIYYASRIGDNESILKYSTYIWKPFLPVLVDNGNQVLNGNIPLQNYLDKDTSVEYPNNYPCEIRYANSTDSGKLSVTFSGNTLSINPNNTLLGPAEIIITATPEIIGDWDKELIHIYEVNNSYNQFTTATDLNHWYFDRYGDGISAGTLAWLTSWNIVAITQTPGQKGKLSQIFTVPTPGWYTAKTRVLTDIIDSLQQQKVYLYLYEYNQDTAIVSSATQVIYPGNGGLGSAWTWKDMQISYYTISTILGVQIVAINPSSNSAWGSIYLNSILVYPASPQINQHSSGTIVPLTNTSFDAGTTGWILESYGDATNAGLWIADSSILALTQNSGNKGKASQVYQLPHIGENALISVQVYSDVSTIINTQKIYLYLYSYDSDYHKIIESGNAVYYPGKWEPNRWHQITFAYTPLNNNNAIQIVGISSLGYPSATIYFDEIKVKQGHDLYYYWDHTLH